MSFMLSNEEYENYKLGQEKIRRLENQVADFKTDTAGVTKLLCAAARCGFTSPDQEDAILFALERLMKEPRAVIKLILDAPPKGYTRGA